MEMILEKQKEAKAYRLKDERDFYFLIEQRLKKQGFRVLDTLRRISEKKRVEELCV